MDQIGWRLIGSASLGAIVAAGLMAGYQAAWGITDFSAETLGTAGVLGAVIAALTVWRTSRTYRRLLVRLAERIAALHQNPSLHNLHELDGLRSPCPELTPVREQLAWLTNCYRRALADLVFAKEVPNTLSLSGDEDLEQTGSSPIADRAGIERGFHLRKAELSEANERLRKTNEDLQRLKESYRDLYNNAPVLYFGLDSGGRFVALNDTLLRTLGHQREALLGQPFACLLTAAGRERLRKDPSMCLRTGGLETQWVKSDGTILDVWIDTTVLRDERGAFVRSRSAARDSTERKRLTGEIRAKTAELDRADAQLRRFKEEFEDFTRAGSHDLQESLRTLETLDRLWAEDDSLSQGEEGRVHWNQFLAAGRRLAARMDDLRALSRAGEIVRMSRVFSWSEALRTLRADLHDALGRRQATLRVDDPLPPVCGDPERILLLLANLIRNGLQHNTASHPEIIVGATAVPDPPRGPSAAAGKRKADFVTLFVRDNGIGIDPVDHERIFRLFHRIHARDASEGTGASLTICQRIIEAHGGRIWVESCLGLGATFYFTLPRLQSAESPTVPESAPCETDGIPSGLLV